MLIKVLLYHFYSRGSENSIAYSVVYDCCTYLLHHVKYCFIVQAQGIWQVVAVKIIVSSDRASGSYWLDNNCRSGYHVVLYPYS
jgi:hypothetical protein